MTDSVLAFADAQLDASIDRLAALMRVPSVSTDPAYAADCRRVSLLLRAQMLSLAGHDLRFVREVSVAERSVLNIACRSLAYKAAKLTAGAAVADDDGRRLVL